jgi:hypothetical protein
MVTPISLNIYITNDAIIGGAYLINSVGLPLVEDHQDASLLYMRTQVNAFNAEEQTYVDAHNSKYSSIKNLINDIGSRLPDSIKPAVTFCPDVQAAQVNTTALGLDTFQCRILNRIVYCVTVLQSCQNKATNGRFVLAGLDRRTIYF